VIQLFDLPLSPYAQKVKLALLEKNIPFDVHGVNLLQPDATFLSVSPRRQAPVLVCDDMAVFDSTIILEFIEDSWPERPLLPQDAALRANARMVEDVCDTTYDAINWSVMVAAERADSGSAQTINRKAASQVNEINGWLDSRLDSDGWFGGLGTLWTDICVYPFVNAAASQGNKPKPGSKLEAWLHRMRGRASASRVRNDIRVYLEGLRERTSTTSSKSGVRQRTFRDHRLEWMMVNGGKEIVLDGVEEGTATYTEISFL